MMQGSKAASEVLWAPYIHSKQLQSCNVRDLVQGSSLITGTIRPLWAGGNSLTEAQTVAKGGPPALCLLHDQGWPDRVSADSSAAILDRAVIMAEDCCNTHLTTAQLEKGVKELAVGLWLQSGGSVDVPCWPEGAQTEGLFLIFLVRPRSLLFHFQLFKDTEEVRVYLILECF